MHLLSDLSCILLDLLKVLRPDVLCGQDAGRVSGVDTGELDVLHDSRDISVSSVGDRVRLALQSVVQEAVDQDRAVRCDADCGSHVFFHGFVVIDYFHAASAENVGRADHDRVADLVRDRLRLVNADSHSGFRHRNSELVHHVAEEVAVLSEVDDFRRRSENIYAVPLQVCGEIQRSLSAELRDDTDRFLFIVDTEDILERQRLKVELVGGVVVCGDRLRVAVDDDRLKAELPERFRGVDTAVIELDTLADPVRASAEDHDLLRIRVDRVVVRRVVGRVEIGRIFRSRDVDAVPGLCHAERFPAVPDRVFRDTQDFAEVLICKAVLLCAYEHFICKVRTGCDERFLFLYELFHLLDEIRFDLRMLKDLVDRCSLSQRLIHDEMALRGGCIEHFYEGLFGEFPEVLDMAEPVAAFFERTNCLLEGLLVGLADGHDLSDGAHLRAELVLDPFEFLECPAGELHDDVIAVGNILVERPVLSAWQISQCEACRELCGDEGDREAGRLGGERGASGGTRVDLYYDDAV